MKSFSDWTIEEVENEFGIRPTSKSQLLDEWLGINPSPSEVEQQVLTNLQRRLAEGSYAWNEQELIAKFIAPLLSLVDFQQEKYCDFLNRELSVPYKNDTLKGDVDFVVAQGRHSPQRLFFFLHEYKKENSQKDPLGQLMIAMVAAQLLNQDEQPLYGAYIIGRYWHFVVLEGKSYTVHIGFNGAGDEIQSIFAALQNMRSIIEQMMKEK